MGPSEFLATGLLRDWDVSDRFGDIRVPTPITSGRHDEATPVQTELVRDRIPDAEWVLFDHSAHAPLAEEPKRYRALLEGFLQHVEQPARSNARPRTLAWGHLV